MTSHSWPQTALAAMIKQTGQRAQIWLACRFPDLIAAGFGQTVPDESLQTAYAELGLALFVLRKPCCADWQPQIEQLTLQLQRAYENPALHGFARSGPAGALIGQVMIRLGLGRRADAIFPAAQMHTIIARRSPEFPQNPPWKPLEMTFALSASGLSHLAPATGCHLLQDITELLVQTGLDDPQLIYTFTHMVFYQTHFGQQPPPEALRDTWLTLTKQALARCCATGHLDLIAEVLIVAALLGFSGDAAVAKAWHHLAQAQSADGAMTGSYMCGPTQAEYHKCLVTVIAAQINLQAIYSRSARVPS